jgi:hypothetical protein
MWLALQNSFTWTLWTDEWRIIQIFEIDSKITQSETWIVKYNDYLESIRTKKGRINETYLPWKNRLDTLSKLLMNEFHNYVDPIEYLLYLYKEEELSIAWIQERYPTVFNCDLKSTYKFFQRLWWKMRDWNEWTRISNAKRDTSAINKISTEKAEKLQDDLKSTVEEIIWNYQGTSIEAYNESDFQTLTTKKDKIQYLLWLSLSISVNNTLSLLCTLHQNYWYDALLRFVTSSLEKSNLIQHIEVTRYNIRDIVKNKNT